MFNTNNQKPGIFQNPFNPYNSINQQSTAIDPQLAELYKNLEMAKSQQQLAQQQPINQRTVYDDIRDEWNKLSDEEKKFIEESPDYQQANIEYQTSFYAFLTEFLGKDYLKSPNGKAPEKVLAVIREQKGKFQTRVAEDISEVKKQNEQLAKTNADLQNLLMQLQSRLGDK